MESRRSPDPSVGVPGRRRIDRLVPPADDRRQKPRGGDAARRAHHAVGRSGLRSSRRGCPAAGVRMQLAFAAAGSVLVVAALTIPGALVPATIALSFGTGVLHPLRAAAIQRLASDGVRARAASAASACDMALSTLFLLLAGTLLSTTEVPASGAVHFELQMRIPVPVAGHRCDGVTTMAARIGRALPRPQILHFSPSPSGQAIESA